MAVQVTWLMAVGCSLSGAIVLVLMIGMILFALVRMIAESGLLYLSFTLNLNTPWQFAATQLPQAIATRTNLTSNFFGNLFTGMLTHDVRQSVAVLSSTGVAVADKEYEQEKNARHAVPFVACIVGSLVLAFVLAGASTLYVEYSYAATIDRKGASPINSWGADDQARWWVMWPSTQYIPPQDGPRYNHNRWAHLSFGAGLTAALSWGRLTFPNFPLHPLGYLLALTLGVNWVWFSILLGWMLKASILKLGGAALYRELKPLALGLILGEVAAAGFWLVLNLVLVVLDLPYASVHILLT